MAKVIELTKAQFARQKKAQRILDRFKDENPETSIIDFDELKRRKEERQPEPYRFDKDKYYTNVSSGVLNMTRIAKSMQNPTTLLIYLLQWKGYKQKTGEYKKGICGNWYKDGYIVASQSIETAAVDLGMSERTITRWMNALVRDRIIVKEKQGLNNVYVLGLLDTKGNEQYFYCGDIPVYKLPS